MKRLALVLALALPGCSSCDHSQAAQSLYGAVDACYRAAIEADQRANGVLTIEERRELDGVLADAKRVASALERVR